MQHNIPLDSGRFNKVMAQAWTPVMVLFSLWILGTYVVKVGVSASDPFSWLGFLVILFGVVGSWLIFPTLIIFFLLGTTKNDPLLKRWYHPWMGTIAIGAALAIIFLAHSLMTGTS